MTDTNLDGSRCTSWIQDPVTGKLIPRDRYHRPDTRQCHIMKPLDPFKSPIDGRHITCRSKLRDHNLEHGVTNQADYSNGYIERRAKAKHAAQHKQAKVDRVETIQRAMYQHRN